MSAKYPREVNLVKTHPFEQSTKRTQQNKNFVAFVVGLCYNIGVKGVFWSV